MVVAKNFNGDCPYVHKDETAKCDPLKYEGNQDSGDEWQASSKRQPHNDSKETPDAERRTRNQEQQPPRNKISTKDTKYKDFLT